MSYSDKSMEKNKEKMEIDKETQTLWWVSGTENEENGRKAISEKIITEKFPTPEMVRVFRFIETTSAEQDK